MEYMKMHETQSFRLRQFDLNDTQDLYDALGDKRVVKHMASDGVTIDICKYIINESIEHWNKHKIGSYAVVDHETNKIIGWSGFKLWKDNQYEILIVLSPNHWGLGSVICDELFRLAKTEFSLHEVYMLLPVTRKSFRWVHKKGFTFCGDETFNEQPFKKFVKIL
jgi:RimJ/RimL family protein N-acetyltransferase